MSYLSLRLPVSILEELNGIDWTKNGYMSKSDWIRRIIEKEIPKLKKGETIESS